MRERFIYLSYLGIFEKFKKIRFSNLNVKRDVGIWYCRRIKQTFFEEDRYLMSPSFNPSRSYFKDFFRS
jgi:hypothetical protein